MDILPTSITTIKAAYSRQIVNESLHKEINSASGSNGDRVNISESLDYERYTYSAELTTVTSGQAAETDTASAGQSSGVNAESGDLDGTRYLEVIRNRVSYLMQSIFWNQSDSSRSDSKNLTTELLTAATGENTTFSESDYYSPEETASRIVDFALSFYDGGDRAEFAEKVGDAVLKGYNQAYKAMDGNLPSIAEDTISLVINQLQQFASGSDLNTLA